MSPARFSPLWVVTGMSERDDLAAEISTSRAYIVDDPQGLADHLLAAGWSRPRVVTTAAELDALLDDTVVVGRKGAPWRKWLGDWHAGDTAYGRTSDWLAEVHAPLTVVWSPPVESGETPVAVRSGIDDIAAERRRQTDRLGYTVEHDQEHGSVLLDAAVAYLGRGPMPWGGTPDPDDIPGNVAKAGALCAAYIDALFAASPVVASSSGAANHRTTVSAKGLPVDESGETQGSAR